MSIEVRVPQLPESVADATLVSWHKKAGDAVQRDENLVDLETDKVMLEVPAPGSGVIKEIKVQDGTTVTSGQVLAVLEEGAAAAKEGPKSRPQEPGAQSKGAGAAPGAGEAAQGRAQDSGRENGGSARAGTSAQAAQQKLSPSARRIVEEHKLDAGQIPASGRGGHVTKSDVITHIDQKQAAPKPAGARTPARPAGARAEQRVPMTRLRARIAERMVQAQSTQALLTSFNEVDLTEVQVLRARYKERFEKEHGVKLGFSSFFVKACIEALKKFPVVNASVEGNDIVYHEYYDIGVAVSTDRGLMVPVVRDADLLGFADIEKAVGEFARKARDGSIALEDLTGGTFTITNGGVFGSLMSTPIVNPPQSAILGMHKIQERPMVVEGEIAVRPMMYLALTYDHRIIDGREAVQFLVTVKDCLEDPARLMLNI